MRIVLFGCKDTTLLVAKFLFRNDISIDLVTVCRDIAEKNDVAGYIDLTEYPDIFSTIFVAKSYNLSSPEDKEFFETKGKCRLGFCVGWQRLIPSYVLDKFQNGVHGMHGSARDLPYGKGRSPMNWALIEDRKFFTTNLFRYVDGIDNGPVVAKSHFSINSSDTSETLHYKNALSMCKIIKDNLVALFEGSVCYTSQDTKEGESFYPKRVRQDGLIDWRDDIHNIERLVRAVAPPFYGAIALLDGLELIFHRASIFYTDIESHPFFSARLGQILEVFPNGKFLVRCSGGVLIVHEASGIQLSVGDCLDSVESPFGRFQRNIYGFFDN
jgi:methionyl-tRNA formyltransferase